jgi:valyl-tRNA synthetase
MIADDSKFLKPYNPAETEKRIYDLWEKSGYFAPENLPGDRDKPFTIIMPPPNANGRLHAGHALFVTLEDIMTRYKRLRGYKALWLPGTDHAGFETQVVFEKKLEKEDLPAQAGKSRFDFSPEELYGEIMKFTLENKSATENDLRALGASCDWSREKFTLDPDIIKTVYSTFKQMSDDGLIYRGKRIVNWCTKHQTSLSDLEALPVTRTDKLYYMKYGPIVVATVRPETMFGDVAIAVNPTDERYQQYLGQTIEVETPIGRMKLKVIGDEMVEKDFGTGALKITPAHDANDYEVAKRHNLATIEVIDQYGKLNDKTGKYQGLKVDEARKQVVADLQALGLLIKEEDYEHSVATCYKCNRTLEPRIMPQWFVKMEPLAKKAIEVVKSGEIKIIPDFQEKIYFNWLENIRDWNISRQIVWGIPIPAKICSNSECDYGVVDLNNEKTKCEKCGAELVKDPDTFDTWFSSGQWPYATLGYPDNPDFKNFYPTDVMETASDILFFWVARMIMLGLYRTGQVPFRTIYLHGMVRSGDRQKMSKSKGNVISPVDIGEKYGTDALRMALVVGNTPGTDLALSEDKIKAYKLFANKLWNITRFILENTSPSPTTLKGAQGSSGELTEADQILTNNLEALLQDVTADLDHYRFHLASDKLYHYVWDELASKILEDSKKIFNGADDSPSDAEALASQVKLSRQTFLLGTLKKILIVLHPFMPFITEEIWQELNPPTLGLTKGSAGSSLLMIEPWPVK